MIQAKLRIGIGAWLCACCISNVALWAQDFDTKVDSFVIKEGAQPRVFIDVFREFGLLKARIVPAQGSVYNSAAIFARTRGGGWRAVDDSGRIGSADISLAATSGGTNHVISSLRKDSTSFHDLSLRDKDRALYQENGGLPRTNSPQSLSSGQRVSLIHIKQAVINAGSDGMIELRIFCNQGTSWTALGFSFRPEYHHRELEGNSSPQTEATYSGFAQNRLRSYWSVYQLSPAPTIKPSTGPERERKDRLIAALAHDLMSLYYGKEGAAGFSARIGEPLAYPLPFKLDQKIIAEIVKRSDNHPYIVEYLNVIDRIQKTMSSEALQERDSGYDYSHYRAISAQEAQALAQAALRYFSWGVEYSLSADTSANQIESPQLVYPYLVNRNLIEAWFSNAGSPRLGFLSAAAPPLMPAQGQHAQGGSHAALEEITIDDYAFMDTQRRPLRGNPLPYSKGGRDDPRSFAYKMVQQRAARLTVADAKNPKKGIQNSTAAYPEISPTPAPQPVIPGGSTPSPIPKDNLTGTANAALYVKGTSFSSPNPASGAFVYQNGNQSIPVKPFEINPKGAVADIAVAGVDESGLVLGSLVMAGLASGIELKANAKKADILGAYHAFSAGSPGIDSQSQRRPSYVDSRLKELPALEAEDFERLGYLIPIDDLRAGDLVIHYGKAKDDKPEYGIVTHRAANLVGADAIAAGTWVIHASAKYPQVKLSRLSALRSSQPGIHYRRVLVRNDEGIDPSAILPPRPSDTAWDPWDDNPSILSLAICGPSQDDPQNPIGERWIPNTGEYLALRIYLKLESASGRALNAKQYLDTSGRLLQILPPLDRLLPSQSTIDPLSNIIANKGAGFELVMSEGGNFDTATSIPLARYKLDMSTGLYGREPPAADELLDANGYLKTNPTDLCLVGEGNNGYYLLAHKKSAKNGLYLGIRPLTPIEGDRASYPRPGDDIQLRFGLSKAGTNPPESLVVSESLERNYLAVYDKKMLWRANLYIADGAQDWNNDNPWNAPVDAIAYAAMSQTEKDKIKWWSPAWGYNEWNRGYGFAALYTEASMPNPPEQNRGRQTLDLHPSTWIEGQSVERAVAYSIGCHDSPFEFNHKLDHQRTVLNYKFGTSAGPLYDKMQGNPPNPYCVSWERTTAPENDKIKIENTDGRVTWRNYADDSAGIAISGYTIPNRPAIVNGTYYAYRPGLSSVAGMLTDTYRSRSAGVDCVGLVVRSFSYTGSVYTHTTRLSTWLWGEAAQSRAFPSVSVPTPNPNNQTDSLWKIENKNDLGVYSNLGLVVPGDIIYYSGHIMMVASVARSGSGDVRPEDVRTIEAVDGNFENNNVTTHFRSTTRVRTLQWPGVMGKTWNIGRLK